MSLRQLAKLLRRDSSKRKPFGRRQRSACETLEDRRLLVVGAVPGVAEVTPGTGLDGVVQISVEAGNGASAGSCSGALLSDGQHILTSAHCVSIDEVQEIHLDSMPNPGDTFQLEFEGEQTGPIMFQADLDLVADDIETALEGLSTLSNVSVLSNTAGDGWTVRFRGDEANSDVSLLQVPIQPAAGMLSVSEDTRGGTPGSVDVRFDVSDGMGGSQTISNSVFVSDITIHPDWNPASTLLGHDIALIKLPTLAPAGADRYDIYRLGEDLDGPGPLPPNPDEIGQTFIVAGYGQGGDGTTGSTGPANDVRRAGTNRWDADASILAGAPVNLAVTPAPGDALAYDFDDGLVAHDAFGNDYALPDLGTGLTESIQARGDSGGPGFITVDGQMLVSGVASFSRVRSEVADVDALNNNTFGEYAVMTRVSTFASWIDAQLAGPDDLVIDMSTQPGGNDGQTDSLIARLNGDMLEILIGAPGSEVLVHTQAAASVNSLEIRDSNDDDIIHIEDDLGFDVLVDGYGGGGFDTLIGPDSATQWTLNNANQGHVDQIRTTFRDIENLTGGSANDTFVLETLGQLAGTIDGGGGNDVIIGPDTATTWEINGPDQGSLPGIVNAFSSVERLHGGDDVDTFRFVDLTASISREIKGGAGNDLIEGPDLATTYRVTGPNAGKIAGVLNVFMEVENVTGGSEADTFRFTVPGVSLDGVLDGGSGNDTIIGRDTANIWNLTSLGAGTLDSQGATFAGMENITGGQDDDLFLFSDPSAMLLGTINGRAGADTIQGPDTATQWEINAIHAGTINSTGSNFERIERIVGGSADDTFTFNGPTANLDEIAGGAGAGKDTIVGPDLANRFDITGPGAGTLDTTGTAFTDIEGLVGGADTDTFAFADVADASMAMIDGAAGDDTIIGRMATNLWTVTGAGTGTLDTTGTMFAGIENLTGAGGLDTFRFSTPASTISGLVDGGAGNDTLHGPDLANHWTINGPGAGMLDTIGGAFAGIERLVGGNDADTFQLDGPAAAIAIAIDGGDGADQLIGADVDSTWRITGNDRGKIDGTVNLFMNVENLLGGSGNDTFRMTIDPAHAISGLIDGGAGDDTLFGPNSVNTWEIDSLGGGTISPNGTRFAGMENLNGGNQIDTFAFTNPAASIAGVIDGRGGNDTLAGADLVNHWTLDGPNSGNLDTAGAFASIERLAGGSQADTFQLVGAAASIRISLDGGDGVDQLIGADVDSVWRITGDDRGKIDGAVNLFINVENLLGGAANDTFRMTIDPFHRISGQIDGGLGTDTLFGPNLANTWEIDSVGGGTVQPNGTRFAGMENLNGGTEADTYVFTNPAAAIHGVLNGRGGEDTIVGPDVATTWDINARAAGTISSTGSSFAGIESLVGGSDADHFVMSSPAAVLKQIAGGAGLDTLTGPNVENHWTIDGPNQGQLDSTNTTFMEIESLEGGSAVDHFVMASLVAALPMVDGGAGNDTLTGPDLDNQWEITGLGTGTLDRTGTAFTAIEHLQGGADTDRFHFTDPSGSVKTITGGAGLDTVEGPDVANLWRIDGPGAGKLNTTDTRFSEIEHLTGGEDADRFRFFGPTASMPTIDGAGGDDRVHGPDLVTQWTIDAPGTGTLDVTGTAFTNIENLTGGDQDDTFQFTDPTAVLTSIDGNGGKDTIIGPDADNIWQINGPGAGSLLTTGTGFSDIESLVGGDQHDSFEFNGATAAMQMLDGAAGTDRVVGPNVANAWEINGPGTGMLDSTGSMFAGIESLVGGSDTDTFTFTDPTAMLATIDGGDGVDRVFGPDANSLWNINGPGAGTLDSTGTAFSAIEGLTGGSLDDSFLFSDPSASVPEIAGGDGTDTVTGPNLANVWEINAPGAGTLDTTGTVFSEIENLVGGDQHDGFLFTDPAATIMSIDGGAGVDAITGPNAANQWDINGPGTGALDTTGTMFAGIEGLVGGSDTDTFTFTDPAAVMATIDGGDGVDTLHGPDVANLWSLSGPGAGMLDTTSTDFTAIESLVGGADIDTLVGPDLASIWTINGANAGTLDSAAIEFAGMENLTGGSESDAFTFDDPADLIAGNVDGAGGQDTIDLSQLSPQDISLSGLGTIDGFNGFFTTGGAIGNAFLNIDRLLGSQADAPDILRGAHLVNDWLIDGELVEVVSGGQSLEAMFFETLFGGAMMDHFLVADTVDTGTFEIFGGRGQDDFMVAGTGVDSALLLNGGDAMDRFDVYNSGVGSLIEMRGGLASDQFAIHGSGDASTLRGFGGSGDDHFQVAAAAPGLIGLFGQVDNDEFHIGGQPGSMEPANLDLIQASLFINSGSGDSDRIVVNDLESGLPADYHITPTSVDTTDGAGQPRMFGGLTYNSETERLEVEGSQEANTFYVAPSEHTEMQINGNLPVGDPLTGDELVIDFAGTTGRDLHFTDRQAGNGVWSFAAHQDVRFTSIERFNYFPLLAIAAEAHGDGEPLVRVYDAETQELQFEYLAYEAAYQGGVRVAVGDLDGDGIPEIVTAPGRLRQADIKVFDVIDERERPELGFQAYDSSFEGGVQVAIGDVNGDGYNDIVTAPSRGVSDIRVFLNRSATQPGNVFSNSPSMHFEAFGDEFIGGSTVAVADISGDGLAEVIVGSGSGMPATVRVFDLATGSAQAIAEHLPFGEDFRGGVDLSLGQVAGDSTPDLIVGAGVTGESQVAILDGATGDVISRFEAFAEQLSRSAVRVVGKDLDADGVIDTIFTGLGTDQRTPEIRAYTVDGQLVDAVLADFDGFDGGYFLG